MPIFSSVRSTTSRAVGFLLVAWTIGHAQTSAGGSIRGRVADASGAIVSNATIVALQTARKQPDRPLDRFGSLQEVREAAEREYILKKLEETNGNVTRTAELLGLERSNLYRKMKTLGIGPKE